MADAITEPATTQTRAPKDKRAGRLAIWLTGLVVLTDIVLLTGAYDVSPAATAALILDILALGFLWLVMGAVARGGEAAYMLLILVWLALAASLLFFLSGVAFQTSPLFEADAPGLPTAAVEVKAPIIVYFNLGLRCLALLAIAIGGVYGAFNGPGKATPTQDDRREPPLNTAKME